MSVVKLTRVTRRYDKLAALQDLSLDIQAGEVLGLFGHNGAGKTTTMKLILGLISPTEGEVQVLGQAPDSESFHGMRFQLGFLPENVSFYPQLSGREVLRYFAKLKHIPKKAADDMLEKVGLANAADRKVKTYSKGMKQRLGLAQAIINKPRLLLLDEPTVGLDPVATRDFYSTVDELRSEGCAVLLCSHVLPGLEQHIDRAAVLRQGRLCALGSLKQLREQSNLPIRVKVRGQMDRDQLGQQTQGLLHNFSQINGASVIGSTDAQSKMPLLKKIMAMPGVEDVDFFAPSLEQLYAHLMEVDAEQTPEDAS